MIAKVMDTQTIQVVIQQVHLHTLTLRNLKIEQLWQAHMTFFQIKHKIWAFIQDLFTIGRIEKSFRKNTLLLNNYQCLLLIQKIVQNSFQQPQIQYLSFVFVKYCVFLQEYLFKEFRSEGVLFEVQIMDQTISTIQSFMSNHPIDRLSQENEANLKKIIQETYEQFKGKEMLYLGFMGKIMIDRVSKFINNEKDKEKKERFFSPRKIEPNPPYVGSRLPSPRIYSQPRRQFIKESFNERFMLAQFAVSRRQSPNQPQREIKEKPKVELRARSPNYPKFQNDRREKMSQKLFKSRSQQKKSESEQSQSSPLLLPIDSKSIFRRKQLMRQYKQRQEI